MHPPRISVWTAFSSVTSKIMLASKTYLFTSLYKWQRWYRVTNESFSSILLTHGRKLEGRVLLESTFSSLRQTGIPCSITVCGKKLGAWVYTTQWWKDNFNFKAAIYSLFYSSLSTWQGIDTQSFSHKPKWSKTHATLDIYYTWMRNVLQCTFSLSHFFLLAVLQTSPLYPHLVWWDQLSQFSTAENLTSMWHGHPLLHNREQISSATLQLTILGV